MNEIETKFLQKYQEIDEILCNILHGQKGISAYSELLEKRDGNSYDSKMLKRCKWLKNCIEHNDATKCNEDDYEFISYFKDRLDEQSDPLNIKNTQFEDEELIEAQADKKQESLTSGIIKYIILYLAILGISLLIIMSALK